MSHRQAFGRDIALLIMYSLVKLSFRNIYVGIGAECFAFSLTLNEHSIAYNTQIFGKGIKQDCKILMIFKLMYSQLKSYVKVIMV